MAGHCCLAHQQPYAIDTCAAFGQTASRGLFGLIANAASDIMQHSGVGPLIKFVNNFLFAPLPTDTVVQHNKHCAAFQASIAAQGRMLSQIHRPGVQGTERELCLNLASPSGMWKTTGSSSNPALLTWVDLLRIWALLTACKSSTCSSRRWACLGPLTKINPLLPRTASRAWSGASHAGLCALRRTPDCGTWTHVVCGSAQKHMTLQKLRSSAGGCNMQHLLYPEDILTSGRE
jgi:hypothetical protein